MTASKSTTDYESGSTSVGLYFEEDMSGCTVARVCIHRMHHNGKSRFNHYLRVSEASLVRLVNLLNRKPSFTYLWNHGWTRVFTEMDRNNKFAVKEQNEQQD